MYVDGVKLFQFCRWFPECEYVLQKKGEEYVDEVHAHTPANKKVDLSNYGGDRSVVIAFRDTLYGQL